MPKIYSRHPFKITFRPTSRSKDRLVRYRYAANGMAAKTAILPTLHRQYPGAKNILVKELSQTERTGYFNYDHHSW